MAKKPKRRGPEPERLKIKGGFAAATKKLLAVKRPPGGWPKAEPAKRREPELELAASEEE